MGNSTTRAPDGTLLTVRKEELYPRRNAGLLPVCTRQSAQKHRKKFGSSVAYKTIGMLLTRVRHGDACRQSTEQAKSSTFLTTAMLHHRT